MKKYAVLFIFMSFFPVHGDMNRSLNQFFTQMGTASNITRAGAYQDQAAGFYTGGNVFARNQIVNTQLATIQLPDFKAGCGGIDLFMGAFSHISSERLMEAVRAIGSNMGTYAMMLALETISPVVKNNIQELIDMANMLNSANLNSCEAAATAVGSVWPRMQETQGHLCKSMGSSFGMFSDYSAARQGCGSGGQRDDVLSRQGEREGFKKVLGTEFNLAWMAIQENAFLIADRILAEFFMSVSGTIVSLKDAGAEPGYKIYTRMSLATKDSLLNALLYGGDVEIYRCADREGNKCLRVEQRQINVSPDTALVSRVREILEGITQKIYEDRPLDQREIDFLGSTRLPIYKILNVSTAYRRGHAPIDIMDYAELTAIDILFQFLTEIMDAVNESVEHIRMGQIDDTQLTRFQEAMREARRQILARRMGSFKQIEQVIAIVRKTELLEKSILSKAGDLSVEGM